VNSERPDEPAVLDEQRANVGADAGGLQCLTFGRGMRLGRRVVDEQRAALEDVGGPAATQVGPSSIALRREPVHVLADDRAVLTVDLAVADAVDPQVHTEQAARLAENACRIGERPNGVAQFSQERVPIADSAQRFLCARARIGDPDALGGHFNQANLIGCPAARRRVVDSEHGDPLPSLISGTVMNAAISAASRSARSASEKRGSV
jgi:hypothetical protein